MSMWIPNKDMGKGETYIITHYEDLNKARRPGERAELHHSNPYWGPEGGSSIFAAASLNAN